MSITPEQLQAKMTQLAERYLDRVTREIVQLRTLIANAASGNLDVVREIETLTHRMHGSGAMLNFEEISNQAGELERMAAQCLRSGIVEHPRMVTVLERLHAAIDRACANRSPPPAQ